MEHNLEKNVLEKISRGDIKMKSKAYFVLRLALISIALVILLLLSIYVVSFMLFSMRASGAWFLPTFGLFGIGTLIGSLPWLLVFLSALLVFLLEYFAEYFELVYKTPLVVSLLSIIALVVVASFLVQATPLHSVLFRSAQDRQLPLIGPLYRGFGAPPIKNIYNGAVIELQKDGFVMETPDDQLLVVIIENQDDIQPGQTVIVMGQRDENIIHASALRVINQKGIIFKHRRQMVK